MHLIFGLVGAICILSNVADSKDYYCSRGSATSISGEDEGRIVTRYRGKSHYEDNQKCEWHIDAGPGKRIHIFVEESELQYSQQISYCPGYDHVDIKEGKESLASWCSRIYPRVVNSRGSNVTVTFMSDDTTPFRESYKGVVMRFQTFDASGCPPNWKRSGDACFSHTQDQQDWVNAQEFCNYEQGNLASIASDEEYDFIMKNFNFSEKMWIGLSDRSKPGTFTWIDGASTSAIFQRLTQPSVREFQHCVALETMRTRLSVHECEGSTYKFSFLCKARRGQPTTLYRIPQESTDKGEDNNGSSLLIGVIISAVILLVLIIGGFCIYRKRDKLCKKSANDRQKRYEASAETDINLTESPRPSAPPLDSARDAGAVPLSPPPFVPTSGQHVAPPTYEQSLNDPVLV